MAINPFKLGTLISWLEKRPTDESYCYTDNGECLLAQYLMACGFSDVCVGGWGAWDYVDHKGHRIDVAGNIVFLHIAKGRPRTFGSALDRAREAASSHV